VLNLLLPDEYLTAGGSVTFTRVRRTLNPAGRAVRMVDGEGVEDREIFMGVPDVPPNDGTWVHLIESVRGGGVTVTCQFPWMMYGQITGEHPSGVMESDVVDILKLVSVEVVVRKNTEAAGTRVLDDIGQERRCHHLRRQRSSASRRVPVSA
jgi:hypothetical protein